MRAEQEIRPNGAKTWDEVLAEGSKEEMEAFKVWLLKESIRIEEERSHLDQIQEKFASERKQFQEEMKEWNRELVAERKRLKEETIFFEKKVEILKSGFSQLDMDKRKLEKDRLKYLADQENIARGHTYGRHNDIADLLFQGVNSPLALKKRYKDLIKMYHPDNVAGDHEMVLLINRIYEKLGKEYEYERQA